MFSALKHFDVFTKQSEDTRIKTKSGAIISVVAITLMALLFLGEVNDFLTPTLSYDVSVDTVRHEKLRINIDITFNMKCECTYNAGGGDGDGQIYLLTSWMPRVK